MSGWSAQRAKTGWICFLLFAVALACHRGMLLSPLLSVADLPHALGTPGIRDWRNLPYLFSPSYGTVFWEGSYHPFYTLVTFINYSLFGSAPFGFRFLKIIILWINAVLLAKVCRKELGAWSWVAGFLYIINPCHSGGAMLDMKDPLVTLSCLLGLVVHRRAGLRGYPPAYGLAMAAFNGLALASKETGVVFPALLLAMDFSQGMVPRAGSAQRRRWLGGYLLCGVVTLLYAVFRFKAMQGAFSVGYSDIEHLAGIGARLKGYAWELTASTMEGARSFILPILALFAGYTIWSASKEGKKFAAGCLAWMVVGILPVSGLLPIEPLSNHLGRIEAHVPLRYIVLSAVGYAWLLGLGLRESLGRRRWISSLPVLVLCFGLLRGAASGHGWRTDYPEIACGREGERITGGRQCLDNLMVVLMSLPWIKTHSPAAYEKYHATLQSLLGKRTPAVETYLGEMLTHPCQTAHALKPVGLGDFETLWPQIEAEGAIAQSRELLRKESAREALAKLGKLVAWTPTMPTFIFGKPSPPGSWGGGRKLCKSTESTNTWRVGLS